MGGPDRIERRRVLAGGALAACAATAAARAQDGARGQPGGPGLIDVHHHVLPPNAPEPLKRLLPGWSAAAAIEQMDRAGVAAAIAWPGAIRPGSAEAGRRTAREYNEFGAKLGQDHPGRFGLFASLPFPDVDGCMAEIDFALDHLHADGFGITTGSGGLWLGDQSFWPIYEKLDSRSAVVFVHPADTATSSPANTAAINPAIDGSWIEWPMNTARTILSLMASGTLQRFPRLHFIFCHGGGVMPLLVTRIAGFAAWDHVGPEELHALFPDGIEAEFSRLHFECAQACSPTNMGALRSLVPDSQVMFGSDYPFFPVALDAGHLHELDLPAAALDAIARGNAARLLPRWAR